MQGRGYPAQGPPGPWRAGGGCHVSGLALDVISLDGLDTAAHLQRSVRMDGCRSSLMASWLGTWARGTLASDGMDGMEPTFEEKPAAPRRKGALVCKSGVGRPKRRMRWRKNHSPKDWYFRIVAVEH